MAALAGLREQRVAAVMTNEREVIEAFLGFIAATPRVHLARILNSGSSVTAEDDVVDRLVDGFLASRVPAGLRIARLMASIEGWDSDTLDAIATILDEHGLGTRCKVCGLFKVPDEPCVHDDLHVAEAMRRAGFTGDG